MSEITYCISNNYDVHAFGNMNEYDLDNDNNFPILIKNLYDIKMIDCGADYVICLDFNGSIFSFGNNMFGQLGLGKDNDELTKTNIPQKIDIHPCKQIACGWLFTMCLTEDDLLYSFGCNIEGELGLGSDCIFSIYPLLIPNIHNIEYIACGESYSICKTYDNTYYSWGSNRYGQIGHIKYIKYERPIQCNNYPENIISIKCGSDHTLLLTLEGKLYFLGGRLDRKFQLNDNNINKTSTPTLITNIPEIRRIECGYHHFMCIDINNDLWIFGNNFCGQLGLGNLMKEYKPIKHPTLSNIIDISSGGSGTFIKTFDHKIYAFGYNNYSQLGIKTSKKYQLTPIRVFQDNEDIWRSFVDKSKQKSARK